MLRIDLTPHISYSQASCANRCPRQWALRYQHGVQTPASPAMEHGKAVDDLVSAYMTAKHGLPYVGGETTIYPYEVQRDASAVISHMADWEVVGVQTRHEGFIEGVGYPVVGYSDFILSDGTIVDLKCSRQWRDDWVTQVGTYACLDGSLNQKNGRVVRVYNGRVQEYNFPLDTQASMEYLREAWSVIQAPLHPAFPNQACAWCSVQESCAILCAMEAQS